MLTLSFQQDGLRWSIPQQEEQGIIQLMQSSSANKNAQRMKLSLECECVDKLTMDGINGIKWGLKRELMGLKDPIGIGSMGCQINMADVCTVQESSVEQSRVEIRVEYIQQQLCSTHSTYSTVYSTHINKYCTSLYCKHHTNLKSRYGRAAVQPYGSTRWLVAGRR